MKINDVGYLYATKSMINNTQANSNYLTVSFFTGGDLSPSEETHITTTATDSTGYINMQSVLTNLLLNRTEIARGFYPLFDNKKTLSLSEREFVFGERPEYVECLATGSMGLAIISIHGNNADYTSSNSCLLAFACTVGIPGSGADIEIDNVSKTIGEKFRLNNFKFILPSLG